MTPKAVRQSGFALLAVLGIVLVLTLVGVTVVQTVRNDSTHSGRDLSRVRADFAAESVVQWAMTEILRTDNGRAALTRATHDPTGIHPLREANDQLKPSSLAHPKGVKVRLEANGWIVAEIMGKNATYSGAQSETISFKVWYPDDGTIRIAGRATVDGVTSTINFRSQAVDVVSPDLIGPNPRVSTGMVALTGPS